MHTFLLCLPISFLWGYTIDQTKDPTDFLFSLLLGSFFTAGDAWAGGVRSPKAVPGPTAPPCSPPLDVVPAQSWVISPRRLSDAGGVPVWISVSGCFSFGSCPKPLAGPWTWDFPLDPTSMALFLLLALLAAFMCCGTVPHLWGHGQCQPLLRSQQRKVLLKLI